MTRHLPIKNLSDEKMYVAVPEDVWLGLQDRLEQLTATLAGQGIYVDSLLPDNMRDKITTGEISALEAVILHKGLKKVDVAKKANVARSTLYRAIQEPDKTYASVYLRIAKVLDCTVDQLLTGGAVMKPKLIK